MALFKLTAENNTVTTCSLCLETYKVPVILPCLHTYCEQCISDLMQSLAKNKLEKKNTKFSCPECKTVVKPKNKEKGTDSLPRNVVMEMVICANSKGKQLCQTCERFNENSDAKVWCSDCNEAMCGKCVEMHNRMKLLMKHQVVGMENLEKDYYSLCVKSILTLCSCHNQGSHQIQFFCDVHNEMFRCICLENVHQSCKTAKCIENMVGMEKNYTRLPEKLKELRNCIKNLLKYSEEHKEMLRRNVETTMKEVKASVDAAIRKLDSLYETFKKELQVFQEEESTRTNVRLRLLESILKNIDHWDTSTVKLEEQASSIQKFVLFNIIQTQLSERIREILISIKPVNITGVLYTQNEWLSEIHDKERFGTFQINTTVVQSPLGALYECCKSLGITLWPSFELLSIDYVRTIKLSGNKLRCGACLNQKYIVVGDTGNNYKLHLVDTDSGSVVDSTAAGGAVKRITIVDSQIYIACHSTDLYRVDIQDDKFLNLERQKYCKDYIGDMVSIDNDIYAVVEGGIKKFPCTAESKDRASIMTLCFPTNTGRGRNGIGFVLDNLIYTSNDNEINSNTLDGKEIYSYKHDELQSPRDIDVLPSGLTLVLDVSDNGKLHLVSSDGQQHRTLIEKFENVEKPQSIWTDNNKRILYVCGGEFIDVYRVI